MTRCLASTLFPGGWCVLSPPQSQPLGFLGAQQECCLRCAVCLLWGADLWLWPSWWMSTIQDPRKTWLATESLLTVWWWMLSLGPRLPLAFWLWLSPTCLPASGGGWACLQLASSPLVFAQSFVLWAAQQCLRLELFMGKFSLSLSSFLPPFWLSHNWGWYLPQIVLRAFRPGPYPKQFSPCLPVQPPLAGGDASIWATSPLGVEVRHVICGFYLVIFSSGLCCSLRFQNSPQTCQWEGFLVFGNFSCFSTPFLGQVSVPDSFVSLFIFYLLFYLFSKTMGCLSGCLVSSASVQKLFCGIFSAFKCSFDEFVGEKVVSPSYSSTILGLLPCFWTLI